MRIRPCKAALSAVLVVSVLLSLPLRASAQEHSAANSEPVTYTVDTLSKVYQICDRLAENMQARQILVYDVGADRILYTKSVGSGKLYPASITKLFSAYVALQYLSPDTVITPGEELDLVHEGSSLAFIPADCQLYAETLVEGMLLPSGNDAAIVLAAAAGRVIAQDEDLSGADAVQTFVDEMNRQAELLGFEKSHFSNPDGWHAGSHYTCLADMARISKLALENETIRQYMGLATDEVTFISEHTAVWNNGNLLLNPELEYYRSDCIGMKTGYTRPSGYCLMSAFTFEEGEIVVGLFGYTDKYERYVDAAALADAVRYQLLLEQIDPENAKIESVG